MNVTSLTNLVNALRAETAANSVSTESLGSLLLRIVEAIGNASSDDDVRLIQNWKSELQKITHVITSAEQGSTDRNNIYLTAKLASLATGSTGVANDAILIRSATTERAGAMTAQHVTDLSNTKSEIKTLQTKVKELGSSSSGAASAGYHIECDTKNDVLYVRGANKLIAAGYKPFLFRYTLKRNRLVDKATGNHVRGPKRRGWHLFYGSGAIKVDSDESIEFAYIENDNKLTNRFSAWVWNVMKVRCKYDDNTGDVSYIKVGWGKKTIDATRGRRFKLGIAFAPEPRTKFFDTSTLVTNIAEFHAHVRVGPRSGKVEVDLSL